jgi:hypothetical protein
MIKCAELALNVARHHEPHTTMFDGLYPCATLCLSVNTRSHVPTHMTLCVSLSSASLLESV